MSVTATELKQNLGYYLSLATSQTIYITQYGKTIAVLTSPVSKKIEELSNLKGILSKAGKEDLENAKWAELSKKCGL